MMSKYIALDIGYRRKFLFVDAGLLLSFCFLCMHSTVYSQVICTATDSVGSAYPVFLSAGMDYEDPDCEHTDFGPHITQAYDGELDKNVFVFHSHIVEDNDRCQVQDRVRMEIKGGPGTDAELQHLENDTSYYRWKFRIDENFVGASSFNHIYQNKAKGGNDDGFPVLTLTLRQDKLELRHNGGSTGQTLGVLAETELSLLRGQWMEAYCMQVHGEQGALEFSIRSMQTGLTVLDHSQSDIDLWRVGAEYNRPKWGMYRLKNAALKDEEIRFADFCVSEVDSSLCLGDAVLVVDTIAPTAPLDLRQGRTFIRSVELQWLAASDAFGVSYYEIIRDGIVHATTEQLSAVVDALDPATTYTFTVRAVDRAGNKSEPSNSLTLTTYAEESLPQPATNPTPADLSTDIFPSIRLQWQQPDNADAYRLYLGTDTDPPLAAMTSVNGLDTILSADTQYYWRIGSLNSNGETSSELWSFETSDLNPDAPWLVYRADNKPHLETNFYVLNESPAAPPLDALIADPNGSDNTFYAYRSDTNDKFRWRHDLLDTDSLITIVARLQAANAEVGGISHFEMRANGWREKVRINSTTVKLERSDNLEIEHGLDLINEMHLFRIISDGKNTTVYVDESPVPLISGVSTTMDNGRYFEWGKSGGADYGGMVDWIAIDKSGAYAPGSGAPLPDDLFLSSVSTLADLRLDDATIVDFSPNVNTYTITVEESGAPALSWDTTSPLATVESSIPATVPNTSATLTVTAQDSHTMTSYVIDFVGSTAVEDTKAAAIELFPNPAHNLLNVVVKDGSELTARILSIDGRVIQDDLQIQAHTKIDLSAMRPGTYFISIGEGETQVVKYKFNKN